MTWTRFSWVGDEPTLNETAEHHYDDYGYDGYTGLKRHVIVAADEDTAITWWEAVYGNDPTRMVGGNPLWQITTSEDPDELVADVKEVEVDGGAVGVPMTRSATLEDAVDESDVLVIEQDVVAEHAHDNDLDYDPPIGATGVDNDIDLPDKAHGPPDDRGRNA